MQYIYQRLLKERNIDHKNLRRLYFWDNIIEILCLSIEFHKVDLAFAKKVEDKQNRNNSGVITYSEKNIFSGKCLDKSGYIIT